MPSPHSEIVQHLNNLLPIVVILKQTRDFLASCNWRIEIEEQWIEFPVDVKLSVRSRAFVKADNPEVAFGDHFEAVVEVGAETIGDYSKAKYCVLRLYFNLEGQFITEDRYNKLH